MRKVNLSKYLPGLFICISAMCIFSALALPPSTKPLAGSTGAWTATGSLVTGRQYHTATTLPGGQVLVAGGQDIYGNPLSDCEIYDPSTGVWTEAASLATGRFNHTATLLTSGKVLVAGGQDIHGNALSDCEIYDPSTGVWTETATLATGRFNHTATLLTSGQVLVAGGTDGATAFSDCEIYNPSTGVWTEAASLATGRFNHTATLLTSGQVLVAGGQDFGLDALSSCEIYDPATGAWAEAASLATGRQHHTAALLTGGGVLVAGGQDLYGNVLSDCAIYNPSTGAWTEAANLATGRFNHTAILLTSGQVLVAGGQNLYGSALSDCEIYNPSTGAWTEAANLSTGRFNHTAILLTSGQVLAAGGDWTDGNGNRTVLSSSEIFVSPSSSSNQVTQSVTPAATPAATPAVTPAVTQALPLARGSTVPGAPTNVTATAGNAQATVSFSPPASNGGSAITGYTVTSNPGGITAQGSGSPITVTGLTNGTSYTFTVTATNAAGTGAASTPSNSVTPSTVPGAPTNVTATAGNAQATVSFSPPASNGGGPITGYTVTSNPGGITAQGAASPITVTGLTNGTAYTFTVTAANAAGTGPPSGPSNQVTPTTSGGSWLYERAITLTNSGSALSNYQVNLALTSANMAFAHANSNGSDIRVLASDGVTQLPYWIENWNSTSQVASIWVNVSSIPSGTSTIYLLYGNPLATTTASGANTFLFFDDFSVADPTPQLGYYQESTPATVNMGSAQAWEGTDWPHFFTVVTMNAAIDGTTYTYWGWYGLHSDSTSGIGLVGSNDLVNWHKYSANPVIPISTGARCPSVINDSGTLRMAYETTTSPYQIGYATSTNGITWTIQSHLTALAPDYASCPHLWVNPNDKTTPYYLYYSVANFPEAWISVRHASTVAGLASASDTILWKNYQAYEPVATYIPQIYAPNVTYDSGSSQYVLRFESQPALPGAEDSDTDTTWDVTTLTSSSATSGFSKAGGNPYHSGGYACPSNFLAGSTLYSYYCHYTGSAWQITYTTATPSAGLAPYSKPQSSLWTAVNDNSDKQPPAWNIVPCTAWNGASGHCLYGFGRYSGYSNLNMLESNYTSTNYIVGARIQQVEYTDALLLARAGTTDEAYAGEIDFNNNSGVNLDTTVMPLWSNPSQVAAGTVAYNTWYKLEFTVDSTTLATNFNSGASTTSGKSSTYSSGYAGVGLDIQASTIFDNFYVRQYAATPPTNSVGSETQVTPTVPGAPTIGTATAGNAQATVSFSPPASNGGSTITGYTVTSNPGGITAQGAGSPITVAGLTNGTAYTFTVTATNAIGTGPASSPSNSVTPVAVPGAPTSVTATAGNAQATVSFSPPASNGGSPITGYTVTSNPGGITGQGAASPITVTGLTNGTVYTFTITATNAMGTGPASSPSNSVTPATIPGAPTIGTATAGNAQATVSFSPPASNGGSTITGYTVTSNPGGITGQGAASPITVTGLTNGTAYTFTVTATNAAGTGAPSGPSNQVTPATIPGAPTSVTATAGNAQATVSFTPPTSNGGSTITGYTVTSNPGGITGQGAASPITVSGLTNGTVYTFTVTATNAVGTGAPSGPSNQVTPATVPGAPTSANASAGNAQATVSFTPPVSNGGSPVTGYTVTSNPGSLTAQGTASPITVTGLTNGITYTFTVTATNAVGTGAPSGSSNQVTPSSGTGTGAVPGAPTIGTATAGNAQATVSFSPPASNGGSTITGYTVTSNPGGITAQGAASPITVTGLTNGTAYTFTVTATNAVGTGAPSGPSNQVTPTALSGAWLYEKAITLTNNGSALANYQVNLALTSANMAFAHANSNGSDIRVLASDGVTQLPYWIENWNSTSQVASVWVNVSSIPSGTSTIYLLYGNPSATTTASGANTFLFFDDFETADPTPQLGYYQESAPAIVDMGSAQAWEGTDWPHFFTVVTMNAAIDGTTYTYWGWYGLHSDTTSGIGLAGSNDLVNWHKYSANPVIPTSTGARSPNVINDSGTLRMAYETTTSPYQIGYATSTNGITWTIQTPLTALAPNYASGPHLWVNPNDKTTPYYLYYSVASFPQSWISVRHASTVAGLSSASDTILWKNYQAYEPVTTYLPQIYAPNVTYDSASSQYVLRFESQPALPGADDSDTDTMWDVTTLTSSSATSGFTKAGGNPYHSGGYACPSYFLAGSTLYSYYCYYTGSAWEIAYTTATPSSGLAQYSKPRSSLWTAVNDASDVQAPAWNIVRCTAWNGASGHCLYGFGRYSGYNNLNMLESNYTSTNYIVGARIQQVEYTDALLLARAGTADETYAGEIDFNNNSGVNLDTTVMPLWSNPSQVAAGTMAYNTWYKLEFTVDSTTLATNFNNGASTTSGTSGKYPSGHAGIGLDIQTSTLFDNFYVRQYAASPPTNSVGPETPN